jgi:hypothetical protein
MKRLLLATAIVLLLTVPAGAERLTPAERWPWLAQCLVAKLVIDDSQQIVVYYNCGSKSSTYELATWGPYRLRDDGSLLIGLPTLYRLGGADGRETWLTDPAADSLNGNETPEPSPTATGTRNS